MRRIWSRALIAVACLLTAGGVMAGVVNRQLLDGSTFAEHADQVRSDTAVSQLIGQQISDRVVELNPNLVALRPAIEAITVALVRSSAFSPIVTAAAQQAHEALTEPGSGALVLRLADLTAVLSAALKAIAPDIAAQLPSDVDVTLADIGSQSFADTTIHLAHLVTLLSWLLPLLALLLMALGIVLGPIRLRALSACGMAVTAAGVLIGIATFAVTVAVSRMDRGQLEGALVAASWDQISGAFWSAAVLVILAGVPIVAVAGGRLPELSPRDLLTWARATAERIDPPPAGQAALGVLGIAVGAVIVYRPVLSLTVGASVIGLGLIAVGIGRISQLAARHAMSQAAVARRRWRIPALVAVGSVIALLPVLGLARPVEQQMRPIPSVPSSSGCNGHDQLCTRAYNDVAYPSTHNAMSAANQPGWFIPEQPDGLVAQLNAGIRALLIDTWYGQRTQNGDVVATAGPDRAAALAQLEQAYGAAVVESALRLRNAVDLTPTGPIEPYLCHGLCELGSTPLLPALQGVATWLAAHPREVVTFIIEDSITPQDTATAFAQAGLLPYTHTQAPGQPWPTLGQMIEANQRLVVFTERRAGGADAPWLMQAFDWIQDTSYSNPTQASLGCERLRGTDASPLLLINNFLTRFDTRVTDSRTINSASALLPYVQRCERERGMLPNFVAVDFYSQGDVFGVVDALNRVG